MNSTACVVHVRPEHTLDVEGRTTVWLVSSLTSTYGLNCKIKTSNFLFLVKYNRVKLETSRPVVLPPMVSECSLVPYIHFIQNSSMGSIENNRF